jgi:hypothetical protein
MATVNVTYYGMDGTGRTLTEAKKDAGRKVEAAMKGSYSPRLLHSRGWTVILWRDPYGWRHNTIAEAGKVRTENAFRCYSSGYADELDAYAAALSHLAQMTWDGMEKLPPCLASLPVIMTRDSQGRRLLADFASWRAFQLAYKAAPADMQEGHRHRWACENAHNFAAA